jgi:predicted RNase H-like HicB family nuclease
MEFKVILEYDPEEKCWVTYVPGLDNISTWGKSREEALRNTEEAITGYLEALKKDGLPFPAQKSIETVNIVVAL